MSGSAIEAVRAREILDSRGRPTVEAEVALAGGAVGRAAVPSGASTGSQEAVELRDGDPGRYAGKGVRRAVSHVTGEIAAAVRGLDALEQRELDERLDALDGTEGGRKARLGANAVLAVSLATAHAAAAHLRLPLYRYLNRHCVESVQPLLPVPLLNVVNGGAHAHNALDFQEFMLAPRGAGSFAEAIEWSSRVFHTLCEAARLRSYGVGDEGGLSIATPAGLGPRETVRFVLDRLKATVHKAGHSFEREGDFAIALDPAASEFFEDGAYVLGSRQRGAQPERWTPAALVDFYAELTSEYPIASIEDGMAEDDDEGWRLITERLGARCQLVGDDLFVTNPAIFRRGIEAGVANAILVKVNQIGTLTESLDVIRMARDAGYGVVVSHRSGETEDTTIADLAVATGAGQIKTGSISRADRVAKYNRLLWIEDELGGDARYGGAL